MRVQSAERFALLSWCRYSRPTTNNTRDRCVKSFARCSVMSYVQLSVSMLCWEDDFQLKALQRQRKLSNQPVLDCTQRSVLELGAWQEVLPKGITAVGILIWQFSPPAPPFTLLLSSTPQNLPTSSTVHCYAFTISVSLFTLSFFFFLLMSYCFLFL